MLLLLLFCARPGSSVQHRQSAEMEQRGRLVEMYERELEMLWMPIHEQACHTVFQVHNFARKRHADVKELLTMEKLDTVLFLNWEAATQRQTVLHDVIHYPLPTTH